MKNIFNRLFRKFIKPKIEPKPYVETPTRCDMCGNLGTCIRYGNVVESTTTNDTTRHFILGRGEICFEDWCKTNYDKFDRTQIITTEEMKILIKRAEEYKANEQKNN